MEQTAIQIGNSVGAIIPSVFRKQMGIKKGKKLFFVPTSDSQSIILTVKPGNRTMSSITPDFLSVLAGINKRYGSALTKLAKM
jgi:bifunctional DNA-binding transcriptional regulator/antitoxin component of YhaV-PrlF toxin-antitoxin module